MNLCFVLGNFKYLRVKIAKVPMLFLKNDNLKKVCIKASSVCSDR